MQYSVATFDGFGLKDFNISFFWYETKFNMANKTDFILTTNVCFFWNTELYYSLTVPCLRPQPMKRIFLSSNFNFTKQNFIFNPVKSVKLKKCWSTFYFSLYILLLLLIYFNTVMFSRMQEHMGTYIKYNIAMFLSSRFCIGKIRKPPVCSFDKIQVKFEELLWTCDQYFLYA